MKFQTMLVSTVNIRNKLIQYHTKWMIKKNILSIYFNNNIFPKIVNHRNMGYKVNINSTEWTGRFNNPQRSNAENLLKKVDVVEVDDSDVVCDGGGGSLGHPLSYLLLDDEQPEVPKQCLYCGTKYIMKKKKN